MKKTLNQYEKNNFSLGFTLIEIMIVIAVIGILSVVTMPRYQAFQDHYHLESAAQIVTNDLRFAKQLAMDRREPITVNLLDNSISVIGPSPSPTTFDAQEYDRGIVSRVDSVSPVGQVTIDYHGFITSGSAAYVDLTKRSSTVRISIEAQTGNTTLSWR